MKVQTFKKYTYGLDTAFLIDHFRWRLKGQLPVSQRQHVDNDDNDDQCKYFFLKYLSQAVCSWGRYYVKLIQNINIGVWY